MARPTKLDEEMKDKVLKYIKDCIKKDNIPSAVGLALALDVSKKTLYNWSKLDDELLHTLDIIQTKQEEMLINRGLKSEYNSTIVKLMLANHGYSDKQDITSGGEKLPTPILGGASVQTNESNEEVATTQQED